MSFNATLKELYNVFVILLEEREDFVILLKNILKEVEDAMIFYSKNKTKSTSEIIKKFKFKKLYQDKALFKDRNTVQPKE